MKVVINGIDSVWGFFQSETDGVGCRVLVLPVCVVRSKENDKSQISIHWCL